MQNDKKISIIFLCAVLTGLCLISTGSTVRSSENGKFILEEDFSDNSRGWTLQNDADAYLEIKDGKYHIKCISPVKPNLASFEPKGFDYSSNYTIEATIQKTGGMENNSYGIFWAGKDAGSHYRFEITGNGLLAIYMIYNYQAGQPLIGWLQHPAILRSQSENKLSIMKVGKFLHFFINDKYVTTLEGQFYYGKKMGYITQPEMSLVSDSFFVKQGLKQNLVDALPPEFKQQVITMTFNSFRARFLPQDQKLDIRLNYSFIDAAADSEKLMVKMDYKVVKGNDLIFENSTEKEIVVGREVSVKDSIEPITFEPGRYSLQIQMRYKEKLMQDMARFNVQANN